MREVKFIVKGKPATAGSKRGFVHKHTGRVIITEDCQSSKPWRERVGWAAREAYPDPPMTGPLGMEMTFCLRRPKSHFRTGKNAAELRQDAPTYHKSKPDTTKLVRAVEDALTGILWVDDAQIAVQSAVKQYGDWEGVVVLVWQIPNSPPEQGRG